MILDPFARAFGGSDENSNSEVGAFLEAVDVLKREAGVTDLVLSTHFGRNGEEERARGATRLDDWTDVRWLLSRQDESRFFRAEGRDVFEPEFKLDFDPVTLRLTQGGGNRRENRLESLICSATEVVAAKPGILKGELINAMHGHTDDRRAAIEEVVRRGYVETKPGTGKTLHHYPAPQKTLKVASPEPL